MEQIDLLAYEKKLYKKEITLIAGVDEVGRGPLVGPVVAAAVILPKNYKLEGLNDSKKLSEKKREQLFPIIMRDAISVGIGECSSKEIDEIKTEANETRVDLKDYINASVVFATYRENVLKAIERIK